MPRSSGVYSLPVNSWNPAINGVAASPADYQVLINDIASAITGSIASDGQTPITGNLNLGGFRLANVGAGTSGLPSFALPGGGGVYSPASGETGLLGGGSLRLRVSESEVDISKNTRLRGTLTIFGADTDRTYFQALPIGQGSVIASVDAAFANYKPIRVDCESFTVVAVNAGHAALHVNAAADVIQRAGPTPPALANNFEAVFNLTSNTNLRVSVRGSDGVTRTANITLA